MTTPFGIGDLTAMGLPGGNPMQGTGILETMELVRKAWASFSLPPNMAPTMDPDEVARRVSELKAVEQWLVMNLTMLRGTIQALEIQQGTLAALRAFGAASAPPDQPDQPGAFARAAGWAAGPAASTVAAKTEPAAAGMADRGPVDAEPADAGSAGSGEAGDRQAGDTPPATAALNPVAWWDMLQKQFGEVAAAALAGVPAAIDAATGAGRAQAEAVGSETDPASASGATRTQSKAGAAARPKRAPRAAGSASQGTKSAGPGMAGASASRRGAGRGTPKG